MQDLQLQLLTISQAIQHTHEAPTRNPSQKSQSTTTQITTDQTGDSHHLDKQKATRATPVNEANLNSKANTENSISSPEWQITHDWISAFNTSLLTTRKAQSAAVQSQPKNTPSLGELMQTPEFACLIMAAQKLSAQYQLSKEEATERLISTFRTIDSEWMDLVFKKGIDTLISSD